MNPRAAINDLHPFQGCPFGQLGYFSMWQNNSKFSSCSACRPAGRMAIHTMEAKGFHSKPLSCFACCATGCMTIHTVKALAFIVTIIKLSAAVIPIKRRRWDSNPRSLSESLVFKTSSLNHSDTSPNRLFSTAHV